MIMDMTPSGSPETRKALAAALRQAIADHRADYPDSGLLLRSGMQRALRIVEAARVPAPLVVPSLPDTVYVVRATYDPHPAEGVYLSHAAAEAAAYAIAGDAARLYPSGAQGFTAVVTAAGDIAASVIAQPLHTDVAPPHGLPVVDQAAVEAALTTDWQQTGERRWKRLDSEGAVWTLEYRTADEADEDNGGEGWYAVWPSCSEGHWLTGGDEATAREYADAQIAAWVGAQREAIRGPWPDDDVSDADWAEAAAYAAEAESARAARESDGGEAR